MKTRAANWPRLQRLGALAILMAISATESSAQPAGKVFTLGGATLSLEEATTDLGVYYSSMRYNRAANVWNVEVSLTNRSPRTWLGPVVLLVDSFSGTSGPLQPDGADEVAKPFYELSSLVLDGELVPQETSLRRTLSLAFQTNAAPQLTAKVFARAPQSLAGLQVVRTLDDAGLPLPSVNVDGPGASSGTVQTDGDFGLATLTQTNQTRALRFSAAGYLPVWRVANVSTGAVSIIPNPRLARRDANSASLTPIGGGELTRGHPAVQVKFTPGAFSQNTPAVLTPLTGQTLPLFLPQGWSPLSAFWLELSAEPAMVGNGTLTPSGPIPPSETAAFVKLNTNALTWEVLQLVAGNGSNAVNVVLPGSGAFALVVADAAPIAPPNPTVGAFLLPSATPLPDAASLRAGGTVTPSSSPASKIPELVTATAEVLVTNLAGNLPSGTLLRGEVSERYTLRDGTRRFPALFDNFVVGYQRPGDTRLDTVRAEFPIRPLLLFGAEELDEAVVHMDLFAPGAFSGGILGTNGGQVASEGLRVLAGVGDLLAQQAVQLKRLAVTNFTELAGSNATVVAAFELGVSGVVTGHKLSVQLTGLATNSNFVLARVLARAGLYGLEPRERLHSDANGNLASDEPTSGDKLPGLNGAGQYVLLKINPAQGLVSGIARNSAGQPTGGLPLRIAGQPWLTFSANDGAFKLLAPAGAATVTVNDLATGDSGTQIVNVPNPQTPVNTQLASVSSGPRVLSVTPTNNATGVSRVTSVIVEFDKPLNPATLAAGGILLLGASNAPVSASLTLNLRGTTATLLPVSPLAANTHHTISLSTNLADITGRRLEGTNLFAFTTESDALNRLGAQLIIYEPTNGVAPVFGTPGTADPDSPVILVNDSSGQTATILSRTDGSFTNFIAAEVDDFISAVLLNRNGTRNTIKASRQIFRDGSVALFGGGGVVEADAPGGPIHFTVQPGTVQGKTRFKLEPLNLSDLPALTSNTPPATAATVAAMKFKMSGDRADGPSDISLPLDPATLQLNPGVQPEDMGFVLAVVRQEDGQTVYQVVDRLKYKDGRLTSNTFPFLGLLSFIGSSIIGVAFEEAFSFTIIVLAIGTDPVPVAGSVVEEVALNPGQPQPQVVERALPGAFVYAQFIGQTIGLRGRLPSGAVYATADKDGKFALSLPLDAGSAAVPFTRATDYLLLATHPKYARPQVEPLPLSTFGIGIGRDVVFERKLLFALGSEQNTTPVAPSVNISHSPVFPSTNTPVAIQVNASHPNGLPTVEVAVARVLSSSGQATLADVSLVFFDQTSITPNQLRWRANLTATKRLRAVLQVVARVATPGALQAAATNFHVVDFGELPDLGNNPLPIADKNDTVGPSVIFSEPPPSGTLAPGAKIRLIFNEPIATSVLSNAAAITCAAQGGGVLGGDGGVPSLVLSSAQQVLELFFPKLVPGGSYRLTLPTSILDLSGNAFDQFPGQTGNQEYTLAFDTAPQVRMNLPELISGGGVVGRDNFLFALERAGDGALNVYDVSKPSQPVKVATAVVQGTPRDLVLIPQYSFVFRRGETPVTRDLLAVVGGDLGTAAIDEADNLFFRGQYLRIFDVSNPVNPVRLVTAIVSRGPSAVTKVRWSPPYINYFENGSDLQQVGLVDLQEMIVGFSATQEEAAAFPLFGVNGIDADGNGDYVGPNDRVPLPPRAPAGFFGRKQSFILQDTAQRILDYDFDARRFYFGVTLGSGKRLANGLPVGNDLPPAYRTFVSEGAPLDAAAASVPFGFNSRPKRVFSLVVPNLQLGNTNTSFVLALVSLAPDDDGLNKLAVINITLPETPEVLSKIPVPAGLGLPQSISLRPDGLIAWATTTSLLLLDPSKLAQPTLTDGSPHPAIVSILPNAGSGNITLASGSAVGIQAVNLGDRHEIVQVPPQLSFVSLLDQTNLLAPSQLVDQINLINARLGADLENVVVETQLEPARVRTEGGATNSLDPPLPSAHYYVLVRAPGGDVGSGATMELALESLNRAGHPLKNKGDDFPPVRAMTPDAAQLIGQAARSCDAPIKPLTAYRLSSNPSSPFYNFYLSKPFALIYERIGAQQLANLRASPDREIIWSGHYLRAFIDKSEDIDPAIGAFAAGVDLGPKLMKPRAVVTAETFPATYIMGPNPMPANGGTEAPGTFGMVSAHNGEVRSETVDMALASRRMPIVFERAICGQDLFEGAFGRGWDFSYNQHLVELRPGLFSASSRMPQVIRQAQTSEVADQRDVLFVNGAGRIIVFKFESSSPPPEYLNDPLMGSDELGWKDKANSFYLPKTPGVFDLLVRFPDGQFARLTPEGTQYWYSSRGRLERMYDRHPKNQQVLTYNNRDELIQISDKSVTTDRFLEIGYWRLNGDSLYREGLDRQTNNVFIAGKIGQLKDYSGRTVLFNYTEDAILQDRLGVECDGANGGFSGRPRTVYITGETCAKNIRGIIAGSTQDGQGTAVFAATLNDQNKTAAGGNGAAGTVSFTPPAQNTAAAAENSTSSTTGPDGAKTEFTFDKLSYPKAITFKGASAGDAAYTPVHDTNGLLTRFTYPEGNFVIYTYDPDNTSLRSRANLLKEEHFPGPRGGTPTQLTATYRYDGRYNVQSGDQSDFNGNTITYTLKTDGREIESINYIGAGIQQFGFNEYGQLTLSKTPEGIDTQFFYHDDDGFKSEEIRGGAMSFKFLYTGNSRAAKLGVATKIQPPAHAAIDYTYDDRLLLTKLVRDQYTEKRAYDENGNTTYNSRTLGDGQTYEEVRKYNQINFLQSVTAKNVQVGTSKMDLTTQYTNDAAWRVAAVKLPGGEERKFTYDHQGHLIHMEIGGYNEDYILDLHGNLRTHKKKGTAVSQTDYDGYDRPLLVKRPGNRGEEKVEMTYFPKGEIKSVKIVDPEDDTIFEEIADDNGGVDALGRPKKKRRVGTSGDARIEYSYPVANGGKRITSGPRVETTLSHDAAGRYVGNKIAGLFDATIAPDLNGNTLTIDSNEGANSFLTSYTYNSLDHRDGMSDGLGKRATFTPRHDGLPTEVFDGRDKKTTVELSVLGERLSETRPNLVNFGFNYDKNRQQTFVGDAASKGHSMEYTDGTLRMTRKDLRQAGASLIYESPNELNLPETILIPGGDITMEYDLQGRVTSQDVTYNQGQSYKTDFKYDALDRIREAHYGEREQHTAEFTYDKLGPMISAKYIEALGPFTVGSTIYADGNRETCIYPSSTTLVEDRELNGRLSSVRATGGELPVGGDVYRVTLYAGAEIPGTVDLGGGVIHEVNEYDRRKRLRARRYTGANGVLLADVRYQYDLSDNILLRQQVHRHGRADIFAYDDGNRLTRVEAGARPVIPNAVRVNSAGLSGGSGLAAGFYARTNTYDGNGLDLLTGHSLANPDALVLPPLPPFAQSIADYDQGYSFARTIDGFNRGAPDPLGNTKNTILQVRPLGASEPFAKTNCVLTYNGFAQLVKVERPDGLVIEYEHQPNGLMHHRKVSQGSTVISDTALIYDQGRLIEEYTRSGSSNILAARYYYADEDSPSAADIRDGAGSLQRFYYLKDALGSVMAVANAMGQVVERINYDPWGQPEIQGRDIAPPQVSAVIASVNNELLVQFTELVMPPLANAGPGTELVTGTQPLDGGLNGGFQLSSPNGPIILGSITYEEDLPIGFPFGAIIRLRPQGSFGTNLVLTINGGSLIDEWGNTNQTLQIPITLGGTNPVVSPPGPLFGSTAPPRVARSAIGSPFLFHGQYFDYDAGLVYLRARFYDPFTGQFLQRDPEEYEDSVNLYAGFGHNPTSNRDPSGRGTLVSDLAAFLAKKAGSRGASAAIRHGAGSQLAEVTVDQAANAIRLALRAGEKEVALGKKLVSMDRAKEIHRLMKRNPGLNYVGSGSGGIIFRIQGQPLAIRTVFRESLQSTVDNLANLNRGFQLFNRLGWQRYFGGVIKGRFKLVGRQFDFNGRPAFVMEHFEGLMDLDSPAGISAALAREADKRGGIASAFLVNTLRMSDSEVNAGFVPAAGGKLRTVFFDPPYVDKSEFKTAIGEIEEIEKLGKAILGRQF